MHHRYGDFTHEAGFNTYSLRRLLAMIGFSEITSREAGPVVRGMASHGRFLISLGRYLIWKVIRAGLLIWNLAEAGSKGSGIYTRIFLISGVKR
jgi:hypothetical protein